MIVGTKCLLSESFRLYGFRRPVPGLTTVVSVARLGGPGHGGRMEVDVLCEVYGVVPLIVSGRLPPPPVDLICFRCSEGPRLFSATWWGSTHRLTR